MAEERIVADRIDQAELIISSRTEEKGLELTYHGQTAYLKASQKADYLKEILLHPGQSICVYDLAALFSMGSPQEGIASDSPEVLCGMGLYAPNYSGREPVIDPKGLREIKQRLVWLNERLAELISWNDYAAADELLEEREALQDYLKDALNVHGRSRALPDQLAKLKAGTLKSIRRALDCVQQQVPELGLALKASISLGTNILYLPRD